MKVVVIYKGDDIKTKTEEFVNIHAILYTPTLIGFYRKDYYDLRGLSTIENIIITETEEK